MHKVVDGSWVWEDPKDGSSPYYTNAPELALGQLVNLAGGATGRVVGWEMAHGQFPCQPLGRYVVQLLGGGVVKFGYADCVKGWQGHPDGNVPLPAWSRTKGAPST
ncbi:MAG: hypothetical protein A2653_01135 [Candidatus Zambryskibacteria bacterium RIFCSPHIGHO2_01_FULL_43_25]|nr:MAG: hypothetical protein A2653_01135 [Candidatus Zambryskibacteria bacterium RIFCSPHIGHO2_01_FULL_43_25]